MKNEVIALVKTVHGTDPATKEPTETIVKTEVFAEEKSVWQREFYAAAAFDLRPEIIFVVWLEEYSGEMQIEVGEGDDKKEYQLIRSFKPNNAEIELYCSGPGPRPRSR